ncbi:MAG: MBL fold metallo-hydrolase [Rhodospirillaceae bacterium]|nr:MBL fold metallo-hydrolase [Rhodospirillaceae bacterium]
MAVTLTFHGACATVTGSCFELRTRHAGVLIDCGMFQGTKTIKALNYGAFPFAPDSIAAVIATHAHIDHCGLVPKLIAAGFSGPVHATPASADLMTYVLPDSGYIQEIEVERLNRRNRQRGQPQVEPIYTRAIAEHALQRLRPQGYDRWFDVAPGLRARFWNAGHILGSASVEIEARERLDGAADGTTGRSDAIRILFSGDIGPSDKSFHTNPQAPAGLDIVVMESTYGGTVRAARSPARRRKILLAELRAALRAGGMILIPAFAVERTQELLVDLDALMDAGELPALPIFVDSPLARHATKVFDRHLADIDGDGTHPFRRANVRFVETAEESKRLNRLRGGAIIMAGSGMCDAGRIRHHLKAHLGRADTTVLLVGYQAPGTLGRLLADGTKIVRIHGEETAVGARIRLLDEYSGHADAPHLAAWLAARAPVAHQTFLVHGEEAARAALAARLRAGGVRKLHLPVHGETVRLARRDGARTIRVRAGLDVAAVAAADWHNAYAATVIDLKAQLAGLPSDAARHKLLKKLRADLSGGRRRGGR